MSETTKMKPSAAPSESRPRLAYQSEDWETECPKSSDKQHCDCWYDGKPCCRCGVAMTFGDAIQAMKNDESAQVCRAGWNGKGMWISVQRPDANSKMTLPYIYMKTVQGDLIPWLASQADMLAEDWQIAD